MKHILEAGFLSCLILIGICSGNGLAGVPPHGLCEDVADIGKVSAIQEEFHRDATVYSWVEGNRVSPAEFRWVYTNPQGREYSQDQSLPYLDDAVYTILDLSAYETDEVAGNWSVTIYRGGEVIVTDSFHVSLLTGLNMTVPFVLYGGFAILLVLLFIHFRKRKD
jgi:hypothetical protein